jgi:hypothetical protein
MDSIWGVAWPGPSSKVRATVFPVPGAFFIITEEGVGHDCWADEDCVPAGILIAIGARSVIPGLLSVLEAPEICFVPSIPSDLVGVGLQPAAYTNANRPAIIRKLPIVRRK